MKIILILLFAHSAMATCFMNKTICVPNNNFENRYELSKVTCSPPGGPATTSSHFNIFNQLSGLDAIFTKKLNFTRDNWFQVKIEQKNRSPVLFIDDRSIESENNINIGLNPKLGKELIDYKCKSVFR